MFYSRDTRLSVEGGWVEPVSYTHLDVYKRQDQLRELGQDRHLHRRRVDRRSRELPAGGDRAGEAGQPPARADRDGHPVHGWQGGAWPVSYTHLDVYKRQSISAIYTLSASKSLKTK